MITHRDVSYVGKLSTVAQLLELLACQDDPIVRTPDVYRSMAKEIWQTYWYLSARLNDELVGGMNWKLDEHYFQAVEGRARRAAEDL